MCRRYIDRVFKNHPDLREAVTPAYPYPGKRPVIASTFYPALKKDNVTLVPKAVASVTPTGIVDVEGVERTVDTGRQGRPGQRRPNLFRGTRRLR